ncbi:MAG TPA: pyrimidine-nucleoside phosphorylase, partial [Clostridia bacterium]|nr:pyrimidine-nucleoside phosphorylase [Clostridia bacterium]
MRTADLIQKKRNGLILSREEIDFLIKEYTTGRIPDYQMSALTMAIYFRGLNPEETVHLTSSMVNSG